MGHSTHSVAARSGIRIASLDLAGYFLRNGALPSRDSPRGQKTRCDLKCPLPRRRQTNPLGRYYQHSQIDSYRNAETIAIHSIEGLTQDNKAQATRKCSVCNLWRKICVVDPSR